MTSNEIAPIETVELPAATGQGAAIGQLMQHAEAMSAAHRLGTVLAESDLAPKDYKGKPGNAAVAILYGAELGLSPIQSIQQIFVVHGRPAIYTRTMVALVKARGYIIQTVESSDERVTVSGSDPRTGLVETSTWTIERATQAGYVPTIDEKTGKFKTNQYDKLIGNEKYLTDPQGMLYAKAAGEVCRKIAPEVLLGIPYSREELELEPQPIKATAERIGGGVAGLRSKLGLDVTHSADEEPSSAGEKQDTEPQTVERERMSTQGQLQKIAIALDELGITDRSKKLVYLSSFFSREFTSSKELTHAEASAAIDDLQAQLTQRGEQQPEAGQ